MRAGSNFAGIGGFDLAARWSGMETIWYTEINPYCLRIMARHFPEASSLGSITDVSRPPVVDVMLGGFPCQDISASNTKGQGLAGARSGLWREYLRLIAEGLPAYALIENVGRLTSKGLAEIGTDLHALGYAAEWHLVTAASFGAQHERERCFIVAWRDWEVVHQDLTRCECCDDWLCDRCKVHFWECPCVTGTFDGDGFELVVEPWGEVAYADGVRSAARLAESRAGQAGDSRITYHLRAALRSRTAECGLEAGWRTGTLDRFPQSRLGGSADGLPYRLDQAALAATPKLVKDRVPNRTERLMGLGNAVVPQVAHLFLEAIRESERRGGPTSTLEPTNDASPRT